MDIPINSVVVRCTAPVNIAVVKYWGKRDEALILPVNDSLSGTLHQDCMKSETTVIASRSFESDSMWLNNEPVDISANKRLLTVIREFRASAQPFKSGDQVLIESNEWHEYKLHIISHNNFPTAAGLASSASGFACLTRTLSALYGVGGELSHIARQGSGSACRSMFGGWVAWQQGLLDDGSDSVALSVADEHHWPEMRVLICVVSSGPKDVSSTSGMQQSVATSALLQHRTSVVVPARMRAMRDAIINRDFPSFALETIKDSNQFHAVCLDTYPPIFYLNDTSKHIIHVLDGLNSNSDSLQAAYTFDAGPNAVVYLLEHSLESTLAELLRVFKPDGVSYDEFVHDPMNLIRREKLPSEWPSADEASSSGVRRIIVSKLGPGPIVHELRHSF